MKSLLSLVAVLALVAGVSTAAVAADTVAAATPPATRPARGTFGKITKVDGMTITLSVGRGDNAKETTITITADTKITIDDAESKASDLKADLYVRVTKDGDKITKLTCSTKAPTRPTKPAA